MLTGSIIFYSSIIAYLGWNINKEYDLHYAAAVFIIKTTGERKK